MIKSAAYIVGGASVLASLFAFEGLEDYPSFYNVQAGFELKAYPADSGPTKYGDMRRAVA